MLTPTNSTPCAAVAACTLCTLFASTRQSVHHEPQKFSTTTCPRSPARVNLVPSSNVPVPAGAAGRSAAGDAVVVAMPLTKPLSDPFIWFTASVPVVQPAAAASAPHVATIATRVRRRTSGSLSGTGGRRQGDEVRSRFGVPDSDDLRTGKVE